MVSISEEIAAFALSDLSIPDEVVTLARLHFLDTMGVAVASSGFEFATAISRAAARLGSGAEAHAIGTGQSLPAPSAALVNGVLAHGLDYDDTHIAAIYHASAAAFASALAAGEATKASGAAVLEAYIVALEGGCRLALAANGEFHDRHLHPTSLCGPFAAACAAARLYGMKHDELSNALGLCGSLAGGILELDGSWMKRLHPGWAAHSGLSAAAMGRAGFKGPRLVFEGPHGFFNAHLGRQPDREILLAGLGRNWELMGLAIKPYPCCHFIHAFADAAIELRETPGFDVQAVARIDAPLSQRLHHLVYQPADKKRAPQSEYDALFSVPYVIGLALVKGKVDVAGFYDGDLANPAVLDIASKVTCTFDDKSDFPAHFPGEVRIEMVDGTRHVLRKAQSRGTPGLRLTEAEILEKFRSNVARELPAGQMEKLERLALDIGTVADVSSMVAVTKHRLQGVAAE
ncbi:MmgE/PrpD family protein [Mesorhizobium sp. 1B3]|uniref:MmgE/PrpD family protein n=1 Tax=Mesorhizobium sp. 1B3 TaxID=3243599 RepID=UPI003D9940F3